MCNDGMLGRDTSTTSRQIRRAIIVGAGLGAAIAGAAQGFAPLHLLTHEFVQGFCVLTLGITAAGTWALHRAPHATVAQTLGAATLGAIALGTAAFAVQWTSSAWIYDCRTVDASAFFWVTWPPVAALGIVVGLGARRWSWRGLALLLLAIALASGAHDGLQFLNGVRIVDPILGDPLLFNQRTPMAVSPLHLGQRIWLSMGVVALGTTWIGEARWRWGPALGFAAITVGAGSHLGIGPGRTALRTHLDGTRTTDHFVFLYATEGRSAVYVDAIARDAEWHFDRLTTVWGIDPRRAIEVRLYDDRQSLEALTGRSWPHAGFYQIDIPLGRTHTSTLPHELVHALHAELSWNPRLIVSRAMAEGTAVAFSTPMVDDPAAHVSLAAALASDRLPSAEVIFGAGGFHAVHEGNAYQAAGSFLGFLVQAHGIDRFVALQRGLHPTGFAWERIYGRSLAQLDADWRTFLRDRVPVDLTARAEARERFDPVLRPAYLSRTCPKLSDRRSTLPERAEALWTFGDREAASATYRQLLANTDRPHWALAAAAGLEHVGDPLGALDLIDTQLDREDLEADEGFALQAGRIPALIRLGRYDDLSRAFAALDRLDPTPRPDDDAVATCLADPHTRDAARHLLVDGRLDGRAPMAAAIEAHPDHGCLAYLMATRGVPLPEAGHRVTFTDRDQRRIAEVLHWIRRAPEACDAVGVRLAELGRASVGRDRDQAVALSEGLQTHCTDPLLRLQGRAIEDRLAWEDANP